MNDFISEADQKEIEALVHDAKRAAKAGISIFPRPCWFGHKWSVWWEHQHGPVVDSQRVAVGHYIDQMRLCKRCLKIEMRRIQVTT